MVQLRQDYDKFQASGSEVVAIGPDSVESFIHFWAEHEIPFVGLADPQKTVLKLYGQQIKLLKLGRMPAQAVVDVDGVVRYVHYGNSMQDIPKNAEILNLLATLSSTADTNRQ